MLAWTARSLFYISSYLILFSSASTGQETLYPSGYDIVCEYDLSASNMDTSDTLVITRIVANNEVFDLSNLYLADNFPSEFNIVSSDVTIDGEQISSFFSGPIFNQVLIDYNSYRWVIDFPTEPDSLDNTLGAGQTLSLQYWLTCETRGSYILPFHTACFYGNSTGFFTTSDTLYVLVQAANPIPTLSEWGMGILALLLLAAGTAAVVRRPATPTAKTDQ